MSKHIKWSFEADFLQASNSDYGCPCEFGAPPTHGWCEGMVAWRIAHGNYGSVKLDGLGLGFAVFWPKAIHDGDGTAAVFVDERANPAQREALLQIASGKVGGLPFELIVTTFSKILGPQFVPSQFNFNKKNSNVKIGVEIDIRLEPIKNPLTGKSESMPVKHATGFIFKPPSAFRPRKWW